MKYVPILFFLFFTLLGVSQQTEYVDFKRCKAQSTFKPDSTKIFGLVKYEFEILKKVDSIFIDAINMEFENVTLNKKRVKYSNDLKKISIKHDFEPNKKYELSFIYEAYPKKAMYFIDWEFKDGNKQIWTQGQGKYTSSWLPSIDDMNDKIEFDLSITFDKDYEVIANGKLTNKQINDSTITWQYNMQNPMSSYLAALAVGKYDKKVAYSKSGIPLEMYYYPEDSLKFEPTYRYTKQLFDFLEAEIGLTYPWQNYKQVPVKDFLYAGMENTSATIFADSFVIDSIAFVDKNYVNVNAHELAHQWFGDLVTETSGTHHWLQEGFATYYALLAERDIFGDAYYYWRLYEYAQELLEQDKAGQSTSLLNSKSSSTTFYKKGAWVLHLCREKVGDKAFKIAVKNYLETNQFKSVDTENFIDEVEKASGEDLSVFVDIWLNSDKLYYDDMIESLQLNSKLIKQYLCYDCKEVPEVCKLFLLNQSDSFYKKRIVESLGSNISKSTFITEDLKTRQAIAKSLPKISLELKEDYESLLNDKSYITIETALFNLWKNFPQERYSYLNKTKSIQGFNDKNIRILWLTLALITEGFEIGNKTAYFNELTDYTSPKYGFEVRQNAFRYLNEIQACNDTCKQNLDQATRHHSWQFSKFAKTLLKGINK